MFVSLVGIGGCTALQELNLVGCSKLQSLPGSKFNDKSYHCTTREPSMKHPCKLKALVCGVRNAVTFVLLAGISGCIGLQTLNLIRCESLQSLPEGKWQLPVSPLYHPV